MKKRILVVDDNEMMVHFIQGLLERKGHEVITANDGLEALNFLTGEVPDIIFVDLIMPKIGGDVLCKIIRKIPQCRNAYVVVLSAAVVEMTCADRDLSADKYIAKGPFDEMAKYILEAVERSNATRESTVNREIVGSRAIFDRRVTKELLVKSQRWETILNIVDEGILEIFSDRVIFANASAFEMLGISQEKLIGTPLKNLFDGQNALFTSALLDAKDETSKEVSQKDAIELNGRKITIKKLPMQGESQTAIVVLRDVTKQMKLEMQLQHAQKMEAIGTLSTGIAHNFRNTLAAIVVNSQLIQIKYNDNAELKESLERINSAVHRGTNLVERLMQFSRKQIKKNFKSINIAETIHEVAIVIGKSSNLRIYTKLGTIENIYVPGDYSSLSQVLLNLCNNARDAMADGGTLSIVGRKKGKKIIIEVADTGHGMSDTDMKKCFDPFFTTKDMSKGTGLGLSTSYGIVKAHNGNISVRSTPGYGTVFTIELPMAEPPPQPAEPTENTEEIFKGNNEKVLVVNGDHDILTVIPELLQELGYRAATASDIESALDIFENWRPRIVLLDRNMTGQNGLTCAAQMRKLNDRVRIAIISEFDREESTMVSDEGVKRINDYLNKPVDAFRLSRLLMTLRQEAEEKGSIGL